MLESTGILHWPAGQKCTNMQSVLSCVPKLLQQAVLEDTNTCNLGGELTDPLFSSSIVLSTSFLVLYGTLFFNQLLHILPGALGHTSSLDLFTLFLLASWKRIYKSGYN